ncbi:MAG: FecR family protein [Elusimicrobia bacterium]|nr:FecR family protein [Elusimicrobiota bacterium]
MSAEFQSAEPRNSRTRIRAAVAALILAVSFHALLAQAVSITSADGKVLFLKSGSYTWAQVSTGHALAAGDQLKTATGARATVTFDDGSRVDLNPGSSFTLKEASPQASGMELKLGSLKAWISKSLNRRFQVRTPTAVCSVRGTEFGVDVDQGGDTRVQMFGGLLAVADKAGNEVLIKDRESLSVTSEGLGRVTDAGTREERGDSDARQVAKREVDLRMSKEEVQAAAAEESKLSEFQEGKAIIDVNGNRVRIEEYIVRPAADQFKLVVLNERADRFDYFFYHGTFNQALPSDMSVALRQISGCLDVACSYFMTSYRTGRSNTQDSMLETASGGHLVDINNNAYGTPDDVTAAYDPATASFIPVATGRPFFTTLYDNYNLAFNGVSHQSWAGVNIQNMKNGQALAPVFTNVTTVQTQPGCAPPNCTYNEISEGVFHDVVYAANGDGSVWEKYDSYVISDAGKIAKTSDFSATGFGGTSFKQTLLGWNFQTIVTASEFNGRKIDLVVEPKIFIQSGLIP